MKTLKDVKIGACVKIVRLHGVGAVRRRILDMGLVKGTEVTVRKVAPAGDPIELTVRGSNSPSGRTRPRRSRWIDIFLEHELAQTNKISQGLSWQPMEQ